MCELRGKKMVKLNYPVNGLSGMKMRAMEGCTNDVNELVPVMEDFDLLLPQGRNVKQLKDIYQIKPAESPA